MAGRLRRVVVSAVALGAVLVFVSAAPPRKDGDDGSFSISKPVACKKINGFGDYVTLPDAALTRDEKLLVYFEPKHYKSAKSGKVFEAHFTQEGRIRHRGQKDVLWSKPKILDFKVSSPSHPEPIYLLNEVALKGLKPGEYAYDVVLRDAVGQSDAAVKSLTFTVIEATPVDEEKSDGEARP